MCSFSSLKEQYQLSQFVAHQRIFVLHAVGSQWDFYSLLGWQWRRRRATQAMDQLYHESLCHRHDNQKNMHFIISSKNIYCLLIKKKVTKCFTYYKEKKLVPCLKFHNFKRHNGQTSKKKHW